MTETNPLIDESLREMTRALAAPFNPKDVKWKPQAVKGNRALAVAFIDARTIQDRLDEVVGALGWSDEYELLPDGCASCRLTLTVAGRSVTKMDVGSPSEQPDEGDRVKAAFSDALKRAAVKFGIGRYLYRLPQQWCDYDPNKRVFVSSPKLPTWARPDASTVPTDSSASAPRNDQIAEVKPAKSSRGKMPADGSELLRRLTDYDAKLAAEGLCRTGDLLKHVAQAGVKAGHGADLSHWNGPAIALAVEETRSFEARIRQHATEKKPAA